MIILRQKNYTQLPLDLDTTKHSYNTDVDKMETTKSDLEYADKLLKKYKESANPNAKNFRVRDMKTGKWRKGTKEDVKRILSPEEIKHAREGYIYESKLNRLQGKEKILRQKQENYSDLNQPEQPESTNTRKKSIGYFLRKGRGEGLGKIGSAPALALK